MRGVFCFPLSASPPRPGYRPTCVSSGAPMEHCRHLQLVTPGSSSTPSVCAVTFRHPDRLEDLLPSVRRMPGHARHGISELARTPCIATGPCGFQAPMPARSEPTDQKTQNRDTPDNTTLPPNSRHTDWAILGGHPQSSCRTGVQCRVPHLP